MLRCPRPPAIRPGAGRKVASSITLASPHPPQFSQQRPPCPTIHPLPDPSLALCSPLATNRRTIAGPGNAKSRRILGQTANSRSKGQLVPLTYQTARHMGSSRPSHSPDTVICWRFWPPDNSKGQVVPLVRRHRPQAFRKGWTASPRLRSSPCGCAPARRPPGP